MRRTLRGMRPELMPTLKLAGPVALAELGWMAMGVVDTIFVGRLGAEAIGAVSIGSMVFFTLAIFAMGLLLGLDPLIAQAYGAGRFAECRRWLIQGVILGLALTPLVMGVTWAIPWEGLLVAPPSVLRGATAYLRALTFGTLPLLIYSAVRRHLQAIGLVWPVMFALVSANLVNAAANWVLVFGRLGAPALGVEGSGWATTLSRVYMAGVLVAAVVWHEGSNRTGLFRTSLRPDPRALRRLVVLGLPAAGQLTLEVGVFALATFLIGSLGAAALAAHQVVLNLASFTFMVPLGIASAAAVRVGHALGREDPAAAASAGWTALALGEAFMACSALAFCLVPGPILAIFTDDPAVVAVGRSLLAVAAGFQLFDGLQVIITAALRGAGDTRTPMLCNLLAYWGLGLPVGYALGFPGGLGVLGVWVGLSLGVIATGLILLGIWSRQARALERAGLETSAVPVAG